MDWNGMMAKVPKCHCLALQARPFDPCLALWSAHPLHWNQVHQVPRGDHSSFCRSSYYPSKLQSLLAKVDTASLTIHQNLLLYQAGAFPRLSWDLMVNDLPLSWIAFTMEAMSTNCLKRRVRLGRSSDPSRLYLPKKHIGLVLMYLQSTAGTRS